MARQFSGHMGAIFSVELLADLRESIHPHKGPALERKLMISTLACDIYMNLRGGTCNLMICSLLGFDSSGFSGMSCCQIRHALRVVQSLPCQASSPNGKLLATGCFDGTAERYSL